MNEYTRFGNRVGQRLSMTIANKRAKARQL